MITAISAVHETKQDDHHVHSVTYSSTTTKAIHCDGWVNQVAKTLWLEYLFDHNPFPLGSTKK